MEGSAHLFGFTKDTIGATDVLDYVDIDYAKKNYIMAGNKYNYEKYPNAIDPTVFMMRTEKCGWSTVHGRVGFFC